MCSPAAAIGGGQAAMGLLGNYLQFQAQKQQIAEANRLKKERDGRLVDKLRWDYGQASQRIADIDKQKQQVDDMEQEALMQTELDAIRAEGKLAVAGLAEGQSTELVKGQAIADSLRAKDVIKDNAGVDKLNLNYAKRDVKTGIDIARFNTVEAINSTQYQSEPNQALAILGGLTTVAGGFESYYSMPASSREKFSWLNSSPSKSSSNLPGGYKNTGYKKKNRGSGFGSNTYYKPSGAS